MKAGYRRNRESNLGAWEGVVKNDQGEVVWACGHCHRWRHFNSARDETTAFECALEELKRRQSKVD